MNLPSQHLSDEAIAAFADGALSRVARDRAQRHLDECRDCARAVVEQREAVLALRTAPPPCLPTGLLDRLRAVPVTTPLPALSVALDPTGAPVFPAYGTDESALPGRRRPPFALFAAAALFVAAGAGAAGIATSQATAVPVAPARVVPAGYTAADVQSGTTVQVAPAVTHSFVR